MKLCFPVAHLRQAQLQHDGIQQLLRWTFSACRGAAGLWAAAVHPVPAHFHVTISNTGAHSVHCQMSTAVDAAW